jgi:integrase
MDQIVGRDMLDFRGFLKRQGLADRTVFNHFEAANSFPRANDIKDIVPKHERPSVDEKPVKKYRPEELAKLFKAANEREWLLFQFFLGSGGREGEVARLKWPDIDFNDKKILFVSQQGSKHGEPQIPPSSAAGSPDSRPQEVSNRQRTHAVRIFQTARAGWRDIFSVS